MGVIKSIQTDWELPIVFVPEKDSQFTYLSIIGNWTLWKSGIRTDSKHGKMYRLAKRQKYFRLWKQTANIGKIKLWNAIESRLRSRLTIVYDALNECVCIETPPGPISRVMDVLLTKFKWSLTFAYSNDIIILLQAPGDHIDHDNLCHYYKMTAKFWTFIKERFPPKFVGYLRQIVWSGLLNVCTGTIDFIC